MEKVSVGPTGKLLLWTAAGTKAQPLIESLATACPSRFAFSTLLKDSPATPVDISLRAALPDGHGVVVCHVDEGAPTGHLDIVESAAGMGFQHLMLCDRDPFDRILAAWRADGDPSVRAMKRIVRQAADTHARFNQVLEALRLADQPRRLVSVEALCSGSADGLNAFWVWMDLLEFLDLEPMDAARLHALRSTFAQAMADGAVRADPAALNLSALRRETAWLAGPWITRSNVRMRLDDAGPQARSAARFRLQSPPLLCKPDSIWPIEGSLEAAGEDNGSSAVSLSADQGPAADATNDSREEPQAGYLRSERNPVGSAVIAFRGLGRRIKAGDRWRFAYQPPNEPSQAVATVLFDFHPQPPVPGIFLAPWSIGYQPIPKVACTSIKLALFELATGEKASEGHLIGAKHIHDYFGTRPEDISGAAFKFIVIRDPLARFMSGYANRVGQHRELSEAYLRSLPISLQLPLQDFVFDPTLAEFIDRFELYMRVPAIHHHFLPMADQVLSLETFDKVYPLEAMDALCADIGQLTGRTFTVPREQRGSPNKRAEDLSDAQRRALLKLCERDYEMLKAYYTPSGHVQGGSA